MDKEDFFDELSENLNQDLEDFARSLEDKLYELNKTDRIRWESSIMEEKLHFSVSVYEDTGSRMKKTTSEDAFEVNTKGQAHITGTPFQGVIPTIYGNVDDLTLEQFKNDWEKLGEAIAEATKRLKH